jgi:asparagine synthase (glutamine-hydrolysing)
MKVIPHFREEKVFPWFSNENGYFRGFIFKDSGECLTGKPALEYLIQRHLDSPNSIPKNWNGCFSAALFLNHAVVLMADAVSAFPLFYLVAEQHCAIGDDARQLAEFLQLTRREDTLHFEIFSICPGNETLYTGVIQVLAGQSIVIQNRQIKNEIHGEIGAVAQSDGQSTQTVWDGVIDRLLSSGKPSHWVIPLSGGWDSRLILASLWSRGVRNIVTYTYGDISSFEVKEAQRVANHLGVEWHWVNYDETLLSLWDSEEVQQYLKSQTRGFISPQEQELFALLELRNKGVIDKGCIALPGYCGDLLAGSYTIPGIKAYSPWDGKMVAAWMHAKHLSFIDEFPVQQEAMGLLNNQWQTFGEGRFDTWLVGYENWFTQQKVSKYILSGLRSFEHVGMEWRMPMWDRQWMNHWYSQPHEKRWNRQAFKQWATASYFKPLGIEVVEHEQAESSMKSWKSMIRVKYPRLFACIKSMRFWRNASDINNAQYLEKRIGSTLIQQGVQPRIQKLNPLIAQYILSRGW